MPQRAFRAYAPLAVTSSGSTLTNAVWGFDDAVAVQLFCASSAGGTAFNVQVSPKNSSGQFPEAYQQSLSSFFYSMQSVQTTAGSLVGVLPGQTLILPLGGGVAFNQLRLLGTGGDTSGAIVAWLTAQINV